MRNNRLQCYPDGRFCAGSCHWHCFCPEQSRGDIAIEIAIAIDIAIDIAIAIEIAIDIDILASSILYD